MTELQDWAAKVAAELELTSDTATDPIITELLDLTRVVAHGVLRPAGPISTYLAGLAVGLAQADNEKARQIVAKIEALVPQEADQN